MARIVDHLAVEELEARYRAARDVTEARHFQAIWLLAQRRALAELAGQDQRHAEQSEAWCRHA